MKNPAAARLVVLNWQFLSVSRLARRLRCWGDRGHGGLREREEDNTNKICKRVTNIFAGFIEFGYPDESGLVAGDGETNEHLEFDNTGRIRTYLDPLRCDYKII